MFSRKRRSEGRVRRETSAEDSVGPDIAEGNEPADESKTNVLTQPPRSKSEPSTYTLTSPQTHDPTFTRSNSTATTLSSASGASTSNDPLGLNVIHDPPDSVADLIFVHGLGGSSRRTWSWHRKADMFWPAWLQDEHGLPPLRVLTFGYNANFLGQDTPVNILDFSKDLLNRMRGWCDPIIDANNSIGQKPIIFVAHSMGGLVVKKAYVLGKTDPHFADMLSSVFGMIFLSTPHNGSSHAGILNNVLAATLAISSKAYVTELANNSTFIQGLNEQFRGVCDGLQLVSIYETLSTKLGPVKRMIVGKDSGILGYPREISSPMNADHHTVCKFDGPTDENYALVVAMIKRLTEHLEPQWTTRRPSEGTLTVFKKLEHVLGISDDPQEDLGQVVSQAMPGSGFWLHERKQFKDWTIPSYSGPRIYWLSGLPGTGKTILAGMTTDHLHRRFLPRSTQHHFFVNAQPTKRSVAYCLLSIAYQIAMTSDALASRLLKLHDDTGTTFSNSKYQVIWDKVFEDMILRLDLGYTLYWVIDAIDECENPVALAKLLLKAHSFPHIRVFILGRPSKELANIASSRTDIIQHDVVSIIDTQGDIAAYVNSMVQEALPHDERVQDNIIGQVLKKADGSFLWAKLALRTLQDNWHTQDDINRALNDVPKDMESLYNHMVQIIRRQPPRLEQMAMRILTWAACSYRPLKIIELEIALQPEFRDFISLGDTIVQICGHFIRLDNGTVTLIHATARQFLLSSINERIPIIKFSEGHEHLASVCFQYLSNHRWRRLISRIPDSGKGASRIDRLLPIYETDPLLRYAKDHWAYHFSNARVNSQDLLERAALFFGEHVLSWIHAIAASNRLKTLTQSAQYIKIFLRRRRLKIAFEPPKSLSSDAQAKEENSVIFLERWVIDLIRLVGKFGSDLVKSPVTIHRHIPPLCPRNSIIHETYAECDDPLLAVKGITSGGWDDNLARLNAGQDQTVSKVLATGMYFVTLISSNGTMIVWLAETFEEMRRIEHREWVLLMEVNNKGNLLLSAGRFTFRIWDLTTGAQLWSLPKDTQARTMTIRFGALDSEILVGYDDCSIVRYDMESQGEISRFLAEESDDPDHSCPRLMVMSPDTKKLVIAYRGRPVVLWDLEDSKDQHPTRCIRSEDQDRWDKEEEEVWNAPEVVRWLPDGSSLFILYQDATLVDWRYMEDQQFEYSHTDAREMVINPDGTFLLTSDRDGSLSVWTIPKLNLLYRLHYEEFVRDLAFSPDGQRIYDTRGSRCNIWEPDVLVRPEELEKEEGSSSCDGSINSEPVISQDNNQRSQITSLACEEADQFYCCGKDDGTVTLYSMVDGTKIKKVCNHADTVAIVALGWSPSAKFLVSADDSGKVIAKRLRIKEDGKWAIYAVFDFRIDETVDQILFSPDESLVLISTASTDYVWGLKSKTQICSKPWEARSGRKWANHPLEPGYLIWVDPDDVHIHAWSDLRRISSRRASLIDTIVETEESSQVLLAPTFPMSPPRSVETQESVQAVAQTANRKHLICEILPDTGQNRSNSTDALRLDLMFTADLDIHKFDPVRRKNLVNLVGSVQRLLGCYRDKIIFLDHFNWLCSCEVGWPMEAFKRHYVVPRDWLNSSALQLVTLNKHGTLLCPRNGEVALVRYKSRL